MKLVIRTLRAAMMLALVTIVISSVAAADDSLYVDTDGDVGVGTSSPAAKLEVEQSFSNQTGKNLLLDQNLGGTVAGENRYNYGIYVDIDSSSTGTQVSGSRQNLYGTYNDIAISGETYLARGTYNYLNNSGTSLLGTARGDHNYIRNKGGGTTANAFGEYNYILNDSTGTITTAYGNYAFINQTAAGSVNNSYVYCAVQGNSVGTWNNSYLFFGKYNGSPDTKWGIYLNNEEKNYFSGNVGIGTTTPQSALDVVGDVHLTGKLTSDGGNDPPYVLYNSETRQAIIDRIKAEVPPDKLNGAVLFFNGERSEFEYFLPIKGEFRNLSGDLLANVDPITKTFEVEERFYLDEATGQLKKYWVKKDPADFAIKAGYELDPKTGKFYQVIEDEHFNEIDRVEVPMAQAVVGALNTQ